MDKFLTIAAPSSARLTVKMSRFLAFATPVETVDEAKAVIAQARRDYHDARHVCWAYMLGTERDTSASSDDGEPSGTAGRPIMGRINSAGLTNIVIVVVRYFGGIKLGTPGLIAAYGESAAMAIEAAEIVERREESTFTFTFPYLAMNDVMSLLKRSNCRITNQQFDNTCSITIQAPLDELSALTPRILAIDGVTTSA